MQLSPFSVAPIPRIRFGSGSVAAVPTLAAEFGRRALVVTGRRSFVDSEHWVALQRGLTDAGVGWQTLQVDGEPSPTVVDDAVASLRGERIDVVVGIGGGSVVDAAKCIAGLLVPGNSVADHLEGVGRGVAYAGPATPLIAVPTTAGTGSEATQNAVLSVRGPDGFKKSFRDERLVARHAVVDPDLMAGCPRELIAANGMDALTQLLESFVSTRANPFTDALAVSGLQACRDGLVAWHDGGAQARDARAAMAYAAMLSGITLAQAGLGSVHGLASPLGAFLPIAHGVACGTLVAEATRVNIEAMRSREPSHPALAKYAQVGRLLAGEPFGGRDPDPAGARESLLKTLDSMTERLALPRLSACGMTPADVDLIVANSRGSSMKTNPVVLSDDEIAGLLHKRL